MAVRVAVHVLNAAGERTASALVTLACHLEPVGRRTVRGATRRSSPPAIPLTRSLRKLEWVVFVGQELVESIKCCTQPSTGAEFNLRPTTLFGWCEPSPSPGIPRLEETVAGCLCPDDFRSA